MTPELAQQLGEEWPLSVQQGTILCGDNHRLILAVRNSSGSLVGYALNGLAKQSGAYADLNKIWLDDPDAPGLKMKMWLTTYGVEKCGF